MTEEEILTILQSMDPNKSMGIDGIKPRILKTCGIALCHPFHYLFTLSFTQGILPVEWKLHSIVPIFKSGERNKVNNYSPIPLLCTTSKVLERLIYDKIMSQINMSLTFPSSQYSDS